MQDRHGLRHDSCNHCRRVLGRILLPEDVRRYDASDRAAADDKGARD